MKISRAEKAEECSTIHITAVVIGNGRSQLVFARTLDHRSDSFGWLHKLQTPKEIPKKSSGTKETVCRVLQSEH